MMYILLIWIRLLEELMMLYYQRQLFLSDSLPTTAQHLFSVVIKLIIIYPAKMEPENQLETLLVTIQSKMTKRQIIDYLFTDLELLQYIRHRGLKNFLLQIDSSDLREAAHERQQQANTRFRQNRALMKMNVLDLTIDDLVRRCWALRLISFHQYNSHFAQRKSSKEFKTNKYKLADHVTLGMLLVTNNPEQYEVGRRSGHHNKSKQIQKMYGLGDSQNEQEEISQDNGEMGDFINDSEESEEDGSSFIDDRQEEDIVKESKKQRKERKIKKKLKLRRIPKGSDQEQGSSIKQKIEQEQSSEQASENREQEARQKISPYRGPLKHHTRNRTTTKKLLIDSDQC